MWVPLYLLCADTMMIWPELVKQKGVLYRRKSVAGLIALRSAAVLTGDCKVILITTCLYSLPASFQGIKIQYSNY